MGSPIKPANDRELDIVPITKSSILLGFADLFGEYQGVLHTLNSQPSALNPLRDELCERLLEVVLLLAGIDDHTAKIVF